MDIGKTWWLMTLTGDPFPRGDIEDNFMPLLKELQIQQGHRRFKSKRYLAHEGIDNSKGPSLHPNSHKKARTIPQH